MMGIRVKKSRFLGGIFSLGLFLGTSAWISASAQDDLLSLLDAEQAKEPTYTMATFKASRLINGQTIETISKNHLNFWISHRFGAVNSGFIANFNRAPSRTIKPRGHDGRSGRG